jgi:hypothetical protein
VLADRRDYEIALLLLGETFSATTSDGVTEVTRAVIRAVEALTPQHEGGVPTSAVVVHLNGVIAKSQVNAHLNRAARKGYLQNLTPGRGRRGHWVSDAPLPEKTLLPSADQVFSGGSTGNGPESREVRERQLQATVVSDLPAEIRESPKEQEIGDALEFEPPA